MAPFRQYLTVAAIIVVVAAALRLAIGIPSGITIAVLFIGWPLLGTLVTFDDDLPGGWSNPDGEVVPEWRKLWWWADLLLIRGSLVAIAFFIEDAIAGECSVALLVAGILMAAAGARPFLSGVRREARDAV